MSRQARNVLDLTYRRNHLRFARMMMVENALKDYHPANLRAAVDALESLEREVLLLQRAAALPKPHCYSLEPAGGPISVASRMADDRQRSRTCTDLVPKTP